MGTLNCYLSKGVNSNIMAESHGGIIKHAPLTWDNSQEKSNPSQEDWFTESKLCVEIRLADIYITDISQPLIRAQVPSPSER